ncbi:hypothetical protein [Paraburkholderia solisilvae]|nr:hypothetical protein [Paraburkholderia solisilvae]
MRRNTSLLSPRTGFANVESMPLSPGWNEAAHAAPCHEEGNMDTHLMIGVAVIAGLIVVAASRDVLRRLRPQPRLVPVKTGAMKPARKDDASSL